MVDGNMGDLVVQGILGHFRVHILGSIFFRVFRLSLLGLGDGVYPAMIKFRVDYAYQVKSD